MLFSITFSGTLIFQEMDESVVSHHAQPKTRSLVKKAVKVIDREINILAQPLMA